MARKIIYIVGGIVVVLLLVVILLPRAVRVYFATAPANLAQVIRRPLERGALGAGARSAIGACSCS